MNKKQFIFTTFQREGYHYYPGANINSKTATNDRFDVSHLANLHMHYFNFKVWIEVKDTNREIEFIQLRRWIEDLYTNDTLKLDYKSCEMISDDLYYELSKKYSNLEIRIEISEEGINGSFTEYKVN